MKSLKAVTSAGVAIALVAGIGGAASAQGVGDVAKGAGHGLSGTELALIIVGVVGAGAAAAAMGGKKGTPASPGG